jgi:hypothetical protein
MHPVGKLIVKLCSNSLITGWKIGFMIVVIFERVDLLHKSIAKSTICYLTYLR